MLNVYGNAIRRVAQTDGYFIFYNVVYKKKGQEREREREREGGGGEKGKRKTRLALFYAFSEMQNGRKIYIIHLYLLHF